MARKRRKRIDLTKPAMGRNFAVRPGAGTHGDRRLKRPADQLRRQLDDERSDTGR